MSLLRTTVLKGPLGIGLDLARAETTTSHESCVIQRLKVPHAVLREGDRVVEVNGNAGDFATLVRLIRAEPVGSTVRLAVERRARRG